ncbi:hypothetical protein AB5I41_17355 [Sphingomonas sp. MMS24-JH45]
MTTSWVGTVSAEIARPLGPPASRHRAGDGTGAAFTETRLVTTPMTSWRKLRAGGAGRWRGTT